MTVAGDSRSSTSGRSVLPATSPVASGRLRSWWGRAGVQVRSAIAATLLQTVVISAAGMVLLMSLHTNLVSSIDANNRSTASSIAAQMSAEVLTGGQHAAAQESELIAAIDAVAQRRAFVQVLNSGGTVVASSSDLTGTAALTAPATRAGASLTRQLQLRFDPDPFEVLTTGGQVEGQRYTLIVGQSLEPVENSQKTALSVLAVGVPVMLIAVAAATFLFVGRSLVPVGAIRRTVENISDRVLSERVPVPPGHDEVARLAGTMNAMLQRLDVASTAQRQFVADASHELRSPIATLQAGADIAHLLPEQTGKEQLVALVRNESRRLERLVADLLLLARSDDRGNGYTRR